MEENNPDIKIKTYILHPQYHPPYDHLQIHIN